MSVAHTSLPPPHTQTQHGKAISKDTWCQFLEFSRNIQPDLSNFEVDGAWPVLIDSFVEACKKRKSRAS